MKPSVAVAMGHGGRGEVDIFWDGFGWLSSDKDFSESRKC